ncbi:MAG: sigma-70 family RNA polymerase sigma factor [Thermoguttaceae bacterium]
MIREALFLEAYPFACRAAQVRSATYGRILGALGLDSDDLEQDAMAGLWNVLSRFDPTRASLRTYAERVVATTITSALRRAAATKRVVRDDLALLADPVPLLAQIEIQIDIERALTTLKKKDRRVARLLAGYRPSEVAKALGISRAAVYRSMDRIRMALCAAGFGEFI